MIGSLNILPSYNHYFHLMSSTLALQSAIGWAGATFAGLYFGTINDWLGRKNCLYLCSAGTCLAAALQTASQNTAMFVTSRFLIGMFTSGCYICGPINLAETLPLEWRAWGLRIFMDLYWLGGLLSAGITLGSMSMTSSWGWRMPSALQAVFTVLALSMVPFLPESPRWLVRQGRHEDALRAVAATHSASGQDVSDTKVRAVFKEIQDTLSFEAEQARQTSWRKFVTKRSTWKRLQLVFSVAVIAIISGNNIITFYICIMLTNAGVADPVTQLQITMYLNVFCLFMSIVGTSCLDSFGRRPVALVSSILMTIAMFLVGGLDGAFGDSTNKTGIYATVGAIFLFQGTFSLAWTPLAALYPPEVCNHSIRSLGLGVYTFWTNAFGLVTTLVFPYALDSLGWKFYLINGGWDVLEIFWVFCTWVETKGKMLEEIDEVFDGVVHRAGPNVVDVDELSSRKQKSFMESKSRRVIRDSNKKS